MTNNLQDLFSATKFNSHPHACIIYDDLSHYRKIASYFIFDGLNKNEKCIMAVDEYHSDSIREDFERADLDIDSYLDDGKLTLNDVKSSYSGNGGFDPDSTIKIWQKECNKAISEGYNALRIVGEATFSLGNPDLVDKLIYYENIMNEVLFKKFPFKSLCVYDRKLYPLKIVKTSISAHPILFYNDKLFRENIHYIPPEIYFKDKNTRDEIDIMLKNIQRNNDNLVALKDSETKFRSIYEHTAVGLAQVSLDFKIMKANEAYCNMLGYQEKDLAGRYLKEITHPDVIEENIQKQLNLASGKIDHYRMEKRFIHKNGQVVHAILDANLIRDVSGKAIYFLGSVVDITERKQAEAERERLQTQLNQAQKMESVGRLAGGVAHDFNNMLGVILGHVEFAMEKAEQDHELHTDLKEIQTAAKRSADITKQLLAFARKQTISPRQLDLNDTVESMLNMLRRLIGEDIDLVWKPAAHLWPVKMDPSQIDQILANLCINARDVITGVGKVTIETGRKSFDEEYCNEHLGIIPGDFVLLAVSDNGCGMDKSTLDNLFEPFFTTKEVGKGTGLGLATIYGIVKQNNGFINVYSEPGQGSTFKIYLPRLVADEDTDMTMPEEKAAIGGTQTILLVEDEPSILRMTRMMLERKGYNVLSSATPAEAMEKAKSHFGAIDLLMTDVVMPEMNGRDLAAKVTALHPDIGLLFMSGYTADIIAHQGVLDEGVAFIQKPFSMVNLAEKIREVLDMDSDKNQG